MTTEIMVTDYQLKGIERGIPLCIGGLSRAIYLAGTRPEFPDWVSGTLPLTPERIAELRNNGTLSFAAGQFQLQLV